MKPILRKAIAAAAVAWPLASPAGGLYMYEIGTSDLDFAAAGTAAALKTPPPCLPTRRG